MKPSQPIKNHPAIIRFGNAVSNLITPSLEPLYQVYVDVEAGIQQKRAELHMRKEDLRIEGYEAAARLMLPNAEALMEAQDTYFERIRKQRGKNDE